MFLFFYVLTVLNSIVAATHPSRYSEYILAPSTRTLEPVAVHNVNGTVSNAEALTSGASGEARFGRNGTVTYDYGKNIGGWASFYVTSTSTKHEAIGLSFTESSLWISPYGSDATHDTLIDEILWFNITKPGNYSVDAKHVRGGFRYLNVYHNGSGTVTINKLLTRFSAMPHLAEEDLRSYSGYFHCNDERLNEVWYAGAYTNQLCEIPATLGYSLQESTQTTTFARQWWSNSTLVDGPTALVDGAKRDRILWSGDLAHQVPGVLLTTNDVSTVYDTLALLVSQQFSDGSFPYFGKPLVVVPDNGISALQPSASSYTYNLHLVIKLYEYWAYSKDTAYILEIYPNIQASLTWALSFVDTTGLADMSPLIPLDWAGTDFQRHNTEANALLVYALKTSTLIAQAANDSSTAETWMLQADAIASSANKLLWDASAGLYKSDELSTTHPQDGNTIAIISGIANATRARLVSSNLRNRWTPYGAPAPEQPGTISPFISGFELWSHFYAGQPQNALDLMRSMWHDFMLKDPRMTGSTFIEGYSTNGSLHYPGYPNDARVSHAHGWASGPITALTNYVAGIHVLSPSTWLIHPQIGDLSEVDAGFTVGSGHFAVQLSSTEHTLEYRLTTPPGTLGTVVFDLSGCKQLLSIRSTSRASRFHLSRTVHAYNGPHSGSVSFLGPSSDEGVRNGTLMVDDVPGGSYVVTARCVDSSSYQHPDQHTCSSRSGRGCHVAQVG